MTSKYGHAPSGHNSSPKKGRIKREPRQQFFKTLQNKRTVENEVLHSDGRGRGLSNLARARLGIPLGSARDLLQGQAEG